MKSYNLQGEDKAGLTLIDNWYEERVWGENPTVLKRTGHGKEMLLYGPEDQSQIKSEAQISYAPPNPRRRKLPPRQAAMERAAKQEITRTIKEEQLAAEDNSMHFTRGRFIEKPPEYDPDLKLDYLDDAPITLYTEKGMQKGRDSHFTLPIQDYVGHNKVKDD
jgi:hypothetical protein